MFSTLQTINHGKLLALFILFLEAIILYFGVTLPLIRINHFWIFKEEQSLVDILMILRQIFFENFVHKDAKNIFL